MCEEMVIDPRCVSSDESEALRYAALREVLKAISLQYDTPSLLKAIDSSELLHSIIQFDRAEMLLYNEDAHRTDAHHFGSAPRELMSAAGLKYEDGPGYKVWVTQEPAIFNLAEMDRSFPKVAPFRQGEGFASECAVPLSTPHGRLGTIHFLSSKPDSYHPADLYFMVQLASALAVAVENSLNYERMQIYGSNLERERDHLNLLLTVSNAVTLTKSPGELLDGVYKSIAQACRSEFVSLMLYDSATSTLTCAAARGTEGSCGMHLGDSFPVVGSLLDPVLRTRTLVVDTACQMRSEVKKAKLMEPLISNGLKTFLFAPLVARSLVLGVLSIARHQEKAFTLEETKLGAELAGQIAPALDNMQAYQKISRLKDRLTLENEYLEEEIRTVLSADEIIGTSAALLHALKQVELVARTDSTVLLLGESGTGKELFARAVHNLSARKKRALVKVNCAAIPVGLLESELFGHARGSFTGAVAQRVGRLELADKGTLFLDEIGDMPLEIQPKLLRAIQEREFERVGGSESIHVNVRIIAATNRNLEQMVADREFREDLFYRLNVFPLVIPPLRERPEDIPLLVHHFTKKFSKQMKRNITTIPEATIRDLTALPYPGNVRELENLIERSVIVSQGSVLEVPISLLMPKPPKATYSFSPRDHNVEPFASLHSSSEMFEREAIQRAIEKSNGMIGGPRGAAVSLGMKRTTLYTKLRRLGIPFRKDDV